MDFKGEKQEVHSSLHLLFKQALLRKRVLKREWQWESIKLTKQIEKSLE